MHFKTRLATVFDKPLIYSLYQEAMKHHIEIIWGWDESWQQNDFEKSFDSATNFIIETNDKFSGYFQLERAVGFDYLRMLIVTPSLRSRGIGRQLLVQIIKESYQSKKKLRLRVFKINTKALRFYTNNGLSVIEEDEAFYLMENIS
ncbi:GNAT family N-acetyltransferase [Candidatus Methylospira mobilis]|uniref:GNAT family N-acetyltransferase n=1 Tax=Candidatus Methylospira mobilis TaxID=1808979 RepID=A0A5Q0BKJ6_9GAMM|nr:GNAT family N-acetyltransferase [Candidatus Methylospira mobilis]QFY44099.1 GNAT family N-acetyltransferase [Candidatus Methylospira mobilis]